MASTTRRVEIEAGGNGEKAVKEIMQKTSVKLKHRKTERDKGASGECSRNVPACLSMKSMRLLSLFLRIDEILFDTQNMRRRRRRRRRRSSNKTRVKIDENEIKNTFGIVSHSAWPNRLT